MNTSFYLEVVLFAASFFAFLYGAIRHFKKDEALFLQIIICAVGSVALGQLCLIVMTLTAGAPVGFHVGMLGGFGCAFFMFSASFGQIDGLCDDRSAAFKKYRLTAALAPLLIILSYGFVLFCGISFEMKIIYGAYFVFYAMPAHFFLKHLFLPDIEVGIVSSIRKYNAAGLMLVLVNIATIICRVNGLQTAEAVLMLVGAALYIPLIILLEKGILLWTT